VHLAGAVLEVKIGHWRWYHQFMQNIKPLEESLLPQPARTGQTNHTSRHQPQADYKFSERKTV